MTKHFDTSSIETIVSGARLLATAQDLDPDTMESIVRKSARVARENMMQEARACSANDRK